MEWKATGRLGVIWITLKLSEPKSILDHDGLRRQQQAPTRVHQNVCLPP